MNKINKKQKIVLIFVSIFIVCIAYYINTSQQKENIINSEDTVEENKINTEEEKIVIHISGAVNKEGVIEVLSTARIKDAIEMAGGVKENADLTNINLAQVLEDGVKIYIPIKEEQVLEEKTSKNVEVNINTSTIVPIILPNLFGCCILAIDVVIVKNISGTIITNRRFKNISPNGCNTVAFSLNTIPITAPTIIATNNIIVDL